MPDNAVISAVPTRNDLVSSFEGTLEIIAPLGPIPQNEDGAARWGEDALSVWSDSVGISLSNEQVKGIISGNLDTTNEAGAALVSMSSVATANELGIDPALSAVTIEALSDGKLSSAEVEAIAQTTGSVVGAAVGGPLGATVGGAIGAFIGGAITSYLGLGRPSDEEIAKIIEAQRQARAEWHRSIVAQCDAIEARFWTDFDTTIDLLNTKRQLFSEIIEKDFKLSWFDAIASKGYDKTSYPNPLIFGGGKLRKGLTKFGCEIQRTDTGFVWPTIDYQPEPIQHIDPGLIPDPTWSGYDPGVVISGVTSEWCLYRPKSFLGQPYPDIKTPKYASPFGQIWRAFKLRNLEWLPDDKRKLCDPNEIPYIPGGTDNVNVSLIERDAKEVIDSHVQKLISLHALKVQIGGELVQSATAAKISKQRASRMPGAGVWLLAGGGAAALALLLRR